MLWRDIPGFKGYQVSNTGLIRSHNKTTHTEKHGVRHWKDKTIKFKNAPHAKRNHARVDLWKDGKPYCFLVARLVAFTFLGVDIDDHSLTVNHIDGDWNNNHLYNLELVSLQENIKHGFDTGLYSSICKQTSVVDKYTGKCTKFRSMSKASVYMGYSPGYVSCKIKNGQFENESYKWRVV